MKGDLLYILFFPVFLAILSYRLTRAMIVFSLTKSGAGTRQ